MKNNDAADIMTKQLLTIRFDATLSEAHGLMQGKRIRHLPVVDATGTSIGILSDRDLQRAMKPSGGLGAQAVEFDPAFQVKDFMSWPVLTVFEATPVYEVAERMLREKLSAYLVVDANRCALGIVTSDDMIKLLMLFLARDPSRVRLSLATVLDDLTGSRNLWS